jgi:hypothetical protein
VYGIIGEADSDAKTLKVLVRRLAGNESLTIKPKGYEGAPQMLRKGAEQMRLFDRLGMKRFIIAYDSDTDDPKDRYETVMREIVRPSGIRNDYCILIPVQEIEAWILADIEAVSRVLTSWKPSPERRPPESINKPKEHLERLSRINGKKPIYDHTTHNEKVAKYLRLDVVRERCPSFVPLARFVTGE